MQKGIGYRTPHYRQVLAEKPPLDFFEIVSENFAGVGGQPRQFLEQLRSIYPVSMHGVSLSIGSLDPFRPEYLARLSELARWLEPEFVSDHLCWTRHRGRNSHDLLPVPRNEEALSHVVARVQKVQDSLRRTIYLENPSAYVTFQGDGIHEADFLSEICRKASAGVLLDLNNLVVGELNLGVDPVDYISRLHAQVCYFHIAGHSSDGPVWIDTHGNRPSERVYELLAIARAKWPRAKLLLEWDEAIPELNTLVGMAQAAASVPAASVALAAATHRDPVAAHSSPLAEIYDSFWDLLDRPEGVDAAPASIFRDASPVTAADGLAVYNSAYFLRIRDVLKTMLPGALARLGEEEFDSLIARYLHAHPPSSEDITDYGDRLVEFVAADDKELSELIRLEITKEKIFVAPNPARTLTWNTCTRLPEEGWQDVRFELSQATQVVGKTWVYRKDHSVQSASLAAEDARFLDEVHAGKTFFDACQAYPGESEMPRALGLLKDLFDKGLVTRILSRTLTFAGIAFSLSLAAPAYAVDIGVPHAVEDVGLCYLSGRVMPVDSYGNATLGARPVRVRFAGTNSFQDCIKSVRNHCRTTYLDARAKIESLKGYFLLFAEPESRQGYQLSPSDCSVTTDAAPKTVTH